MKLEKILKQENYSKEDIMYLLGLRNKEDIEKLFQESKNIREKYFNKDVMIRGVIKFSNYCTRQCMYCGLREDNTATRRYRLSTDQILCIARQIYERGVRTIFLQSGQDSYYDTDVISYIIYSIKKEYDVAVTLSVGERTFTEYKAWKIAGADRYLLKHETSNPDLYAEYHSRSKFEDRINHIKYLKSIEYEVGTGIIIGLPKQELNDIANDILLCKELEVDMLSIGPFIPADFTPYQDLEPGSELNTLKTIAVSRLVLKDVHITSTASLDSLHENGRENGLNAGANVILNNFTPMPYREMYQVYSNRAGLDKDPLDNYKKIRTRIESTGSNCW